MKQMFSEHSNKRMARVFPKNASTMRRKNGRQKKDTSFELDWHGAQTHGSQELCDREGLWRTVEESHCQENNAEYRQENGK